MPNNKSSDYQIISNQKCLQNLCVLFKFWILLPNSSLGHLKTDNNYQGNQTAFPDFFRKRQFGVSSNIN